MITTILSTLTWAANLTGFSLFSIFPYSRKGTFKKSDMKACFAFVMTLMVVAMAMRLLHIPMSVTAVVMMLIEVIRRTIIHEKVPFECLQRALIWIGVILALEVYIMYFRFGGTSRIPVQQDDPSMSVPLYWVVFLGVVSLLILGTACIFIEKDSVSRMPYTCWLLLQFPMVAFLASVGMSPWSMWDGNKPVILLTLAYYVDFFVLLLINVTAQRQRKYTQSRQVQLNQYEYYLRMEEQHKKLRRIHHDLKNQLMALQGSGDRLPAAVQDQLVEAEQEIANMEQFAHTGQRELNIILFNSRQRAEKKGIRFQVTIVENSLNFMDSADVNTLFTNAINNAFEACEKVTEGEKYIEIKAGAHLNDVLILFRNSASPDRKIGRAHV